MIFVLTHIGHVVCILLQVLKVKEMRNVERSFGVEVVEVGSQLINVYAKLLAHAHAVNESFAYCFAHFFIC